MIGTEQLAGLITMMGHNLAHNYDFVPDDKLNWKPSESANSPLEIANHLINSVKGIRMMLSGEEKADIPQATNREEAKKLITQSADEYAAFLGTLTPADFEGEIKTPMGTFPRAMFITIPVIEVINHHGQITYLQSIWGDNEDHFAGF